MDAPFPPTSEEPIIEELEETLEETSTLEEEEHYVQPEEPLISLYALSGMSSPQTLKILGYIKCHKVVVLIDSGNTHNFIHRRHAQEINYYVRPINNFQILIANGLRMKRGGWCENVKLETWDYCLKSHMFTIEMGGYDIVLGA